MNNPQLYSNFNMLKNHKKLVLEKYVKMLNWRKDGKDTVLDIGCAGGDLTNDVILPLFPKTSRFVGVDINQNMLEYARKRYRKSNVFFEKLDISGDISEFQSREEPFDHAISMICLHLVPDQKMAMTNIFNLLKPNGGDCLLYIIADNRETDFFRELNKKWGKYMVNIDDYISRYYHRANPTEMAANFMKSAGFSKCIADEINETIVFDDLEIFKGAIKAVTPFSDKIPKDMQEEYEKDLLEVAVNNENKVVMPYKFMMVYGRKSIV